MVALSFLAFWLSVTFVLIIKPLFLIGFLLALIFAQVIKKKIKKAHPGASELSLTGKNKAAVVVASIMNPVFSSVFFYFGWKKSLPKMAQKANKIAWIVFGIECVIAFLIGIWMAKNGILRW